MIPQEKIEQAAKDTNPFTDEKSDPKIAYRIGFRSGVRFAESEMGKAQTFEIACVCAKVKVEYKNGELTLISAVDGWGDALDPDQIIITKQLH